MQLIIAVCVVISFEMSLCSAQAPGDADFRCTDGHERPPVYPDNVRMLMDSNHYEALLPGNGTTLTTPREGAVWNDRSYEGNDVVDTVEPTYWQQGAGGICRIQTRVCGYRREGTDQNNWLFTQHISKDFDTSDYNYPVEIQVELTYRTVSCRTRQAGACKEFFFLHNYITNTQRLPSTVGNGYMRTDNYNQLVRFAPARTSTVYNETNTFNLQSSQTGFYIAIRDTGSCIAVSRLRVYRYNCPPFQTRLVLYPDAPAPASGSANINIECVDNAVVSGSAQVTCGSDGRWGPENPVCQCRLGYEDRTTECLPCPAGQYRSADDTTCQQCPDNTERDQVTAPECECVDGYFRTASEGSSVGCTKTCDEDEFLCPNDAYPHCIPHSYLCDSYDDCSDGYDELNCSTIDLGSPPEMAIVEGEEEHFQLCLTVTEGFNQHIFRQYTAQTIPLGRAQYGRDFNATNFTITFNGSYSFGDDECVVSTVSAQDDGIVEGTESFWVLIQPEIPTIPIVFIIDNDYLSIGFQEAYYTVSESAGVIELTVSPDGTGGIPGVGAPLGVRITSRDGSAEAGRDYHGVVSTQYFSPPLARGFVVRVNIVDDALTEGEEKFSVELSAFDISIVLVNSVAEVVIEDDDTSVSCPQLPNPPNGSVQYNSVDVGALAEYSCDCGFTMVGPSDRVCRIDYSWSGEEPVCLKQSSDGVCTVDRGVVAVDGNTATYSFCGVGSDIDSFICKLDGAILPDCSSPLTGLSSGTHRLRIVPVGCSENRGKTIRFEV